MKKSQDPAELIKDVYIAEDYGLADAFIDVLTATRINPAAVGTALTIGFFLLTATTGFMSVVGYESLQLELNQTTYSIGLSSALPLLIIVMAHTQSIVGLAIGESVAGRRISISSLLVNGTRRMLSVLKAQLLFTSIVLAPPLIAGAIAYFMSLQPQSLYGILAVAVLICGYVSTLPLLVRLVILPTIALFEPDIKLSKLPARARRLLSYGGLGFVAKLILLALLINIFTPRGGNFTGESLLAHIIPSAIAALSSLMIITTLVVFYLNRKKLRP